MLFKIWKSAGYFLSLLTPILEKKKLFGQRIKRVGNLILLTKILVCYEAEACLAHGIE